MNNAVQARAKPRRPIAQYQRDADKLMEDTKLAAAEAL